MAPGKPFATALIVIILATASSGASAESARLECSLGFGSYAVPRRWIPLYVRGDKSVDPGRIELRRLDAAGKTLSVETFPYRESARLECPVLMDESCASLAVTLRSGPHVLAESRLRLWDKVFPGHIILHSDMPSAVQRVLSSFLLPEEPVQLVSVKPRDLPGQALDYDAVSVIMMADPGPSLSPSQAEALRAWIAGGGRLVVTGARQGENGVLASIDPSFGSSGTSSFGRGRVTAFRAEASELPRASLARSLEAAVELRQYGREPRLSQGTMFPIEQGSGFPDARSGLPNSPLVILLILWAGAAVAVSFVHKRRLSYLLAVSLACTALAVPVGLYLDRSWQRGAESSVRLLALPGSAGFLAEAGFRLPSSDRKSFIPLGMTAWGLDLGFDVSERGRIAPRETPEWRHESQKSRFSLHSGGESNIRLSAFLPPLVIRDTGLPALFGELALADGKPAPLKRTRQGPLAYFSADDGLWWKWDHYAWRWIESGNCPQEFSSQEEWLRAAASLSGGEGLFFGTDRLRAAPFFLQGGALDEALWAMPAEAVR